MGQRGEHRHRSVATQVTLEIGGSASGNTIPTPSAVMKLFRRRNPVRQVGIASRPRLQVRLNLKVSEDIPAKARHCMVPRSAGRTIRRRATVTKGEELS